MNQIEVMDLVKIYPARRKLLERLKREQKRDAATHAVDGLNFSISAGERVGFLGPNGAGKSTTIKIMAGILQPTSGKVSILGQSPHQHRIEVCRKLGVVFGQRSQLYWDLKLEESFELLRRMYGIHPAEFQPRLKRLEAVLDFSGFLKSPVRNLSLGQRIRADLAAAMLHNPPVLLLDEPTIGLDLDSKKKIRNYIKEINLQEGTTVLLTTHDLDDVELLCERLIIINHGKMVADDSILLLTEQIAPEKYLVVDFDSEYELPPALKEKVHKQEGLTYWFKMKYRDDSVPSMVSDLASRYVIRDLSIKEPDIEDVVLALYNRKS